MRLTIATDAWEPQVNGVVRTLHATTGDLEKRGVIVDLVEPALFRSAPCPV